MELIEITKKNFKKYYKLLEEDFCLDERRSEKDEKNELANPLFKVFFIKENLNDIGYISYYTFKNFIFIEHLAILKDKRDMGYGGKFLAEFIKTIKQDIILEVELPSTDIAKARIRFYERLGFHINDFTYFQPSYHGNTPKVEMILMSLTTLTQKNLEKIVNNLYTVVYKI